MKQNSITTNFKRVDLRPIIDEITMYKILHIVMIIALMFLLTYFRSVPEQREEYRLQMLRSFMQVSSSLTFAIPVSRFLSCSSKLA